MNVTRIIAPVHAQAPGDTAELHAAAIRGRPHRRSDRRIGRPAARRWPLPSRPVSGRKRASTPRSSRDSLSRRSAARAARSQVRPARSSSSSPASSPNSACSGLLMCTAMAGAMLLVDGAHRARLGGAIHPAPGHDRLHQRHRRADRLDADQRFFRTRGRRSAERICPADDRAGQERRDSQRARRHRLAGDDRRHPAVAAHHQKSSRHDHRPAGHHRRLRLRGNSRRHDRQQIRRHPDRPAGVCSSRIPRRPDPAAAPVRIHGGDASGDREPAIRGRRRQHERRPAQAGRRNSSPRAWPTWSCRSSAASRRPAQSPARRPTSAAARLRPSPASSIR